ncbi:spore germination protein GerPC [Shimazuella kribbensis]|uniref:spore germination protein GerPC n=1 Tax=Shimazuella kribbensis TaxID=139808 RepID=UPI0003FB4024|nr:spore germination protein GerPC [Shimazuella kribbensis]
MHDPYWHYFEYLNQEIKKMQSEQAALRKQIEELKPIRVEKLEYKIQELNIQTLSGMLNLGLSLNGDGENMTELAEKIIQEEGISIDLGKENTPHDNHSNEPTED